jgi:hypothetical protein
MSGYGHEGLKYGCNLGVLFPWWDLLFGSASWNSEMALHGVHVAAWFGPEIEGTIYRGRRRAIRPDRSRSSIFLHWMRAVCAVT